MYKKYGIPEQMLIEAKSGAHLKHLSDLFLDTYPSKRTCERIIQQWRKEKGVQKDTTGVRRFVVSAAQSNTKVNGIFLQSLKTYCRLNSAELIISGITYNVGTEPIEFDPRIKEFLMNESKELANGLVFCGELNILPTAEDPLSGMDSYTTGNSGIIPHTKVRMKSLPRIRGDDVAFLYTTGAVTDKNYTNSKAGQKASFHHVHGALVVEVDKDGDWFVRQLVKDSHGGFQDLDKYYRLTGCIDMNVQAITWGDVHFPNESEHFWSWLYKMEDTLEPHKMFLHDVYDFCIRNHHNIADPHHNTKYLGYSVEFEFARMEAKIKSIQNYIGGSLYIVPSNHDAAFNRWLRDSDYRHDIINAPFYFQCQSVLYNTNGFPGSIGSEFIHLIEGRERVGQAQFIKPNTSLCLCEDSDKPIECAIHGHEGINGARGTPGQFTKIGRRIITGHTHSASIIDGVYTVGTSTPLFMDYTTGPSTWSNTHCVTYFNGKRSLITCKGNKWRVPNE